MHEHAFDRSDCERHWAGSADEPAPNPALPVEIAHLVPGSALDAGCGVGVEARRLADAGWTVTGVDLSAEALRRASAADPEGLVSWLEADLTTWSPEQPYDLVLSCYAHATIPQLDLFARLAEWVAPGGTLLLVGHGHGSGTRHGDASPEAATVTPAAVAAILPAARWRVDTAVERARGVSGPDGTEHLLRDVVVRATRTG